VLTRWASDLHKHQKAFAGQATHVAAWDRLLVDNTARISALYSKTYQAERDAAEVERQLAFVEAAQDELEQWLDRYEREAAEMGGARAGDAAGAGVDLERERSYRLAESVAARLDGLNADLADVIAEINDVGARLSKVRQGDDPVSFCIPPSLLVLSWNGVSC